MSQLKTQVAGETTGRQARLEELYVRNAPHAVVAPGLAIVLVVLGFNLLGDGLRDALDPRLNR